MPNNDSFDQYGMDEKGRTDAAARAVGGWLPCMLPEITEFDEVWREPLPKDNFVLAKRLAMWCMHKASGMMLEQGCHPVTFILAKSKTQMAALNEHELREEIESGGTAMQDLQEIFGNDGDKADEPGQRELPPKEFKDAMARHLRAVVKSMKPIVVLHIAEAKMASIRVDAGGEEGEIVRKMNAGEISMAEIPDKFIDEILMVRAEIESGKVIMLRRKILRNQHSTFVGLGSIELQYEDMNEPPPPGITEEGADRGRFTRFWDCKDLGDMEAFSVEVYKTISKETWKL